MIRIEEAKAVLAVRGWLGQTPPAFREKVLSRSILRQFAKDEKVYRFGDEPGGLWGLAQGAVLVDFPDFAGRTTLVHLAHPGFWTGEASLVTGQERIIGLTATRDCSLLYLSRASFLAIAAIDPDAWRWVALATLGHVRTALGISHDLRIPQSEHRIVAMLLRLAGMTNPDPASWPDVLEIGLTQERLAEYSNVSRAGLAGVLRTLVAEGLIRLEYRRIIVIDGPGLITRMARHG